MRTLTTIEAEQLYRIPAATFAQWCREGKILGATQINNRWQFPQDAIEQFFNDNPGLRPSPFIGDNPTWARFSVAATLLGFAMDAYALYNIIIGGTRITLWISALILSTLLWLCALYVRRAKRRTRILSYQGDIPIFEEKPLYTNRLLRGVSTIILWAIPTFMILAIIGYNVWRIIPPQQTIILVADFVDPTGIDTRDVTADLVKQMETTLADHPNILIKRLGEAIKRENGNETALAIGQRPEHKAAIVIWGHYVSPPDPELTVHFHMTQPNATYLASGFDQRYTPIQINQPTMFEFKLDLGKQLGQLVAFATGLSLFDIDQNKDAISLFDTAATALNTPLGKDLERAIRFYRGTNFLFLGRARNAQADLEVLTMAGISDEFSLASKGNLGLAYADLGQVEEAIEYYQQALVIAREISDRRSEGNQLGSLGLAYADLGQVEEAIEYYEQALVIAREISDRRSEGNQLGNLGLAYTDLGQVEEAIGYHQQALVISREIGDRRGESADLGNLGNTYDSLGNVEEAIDYHQQALVISREIGNRRIESNQLGNLGNAYRNLGQVEQAISYYQQALTIAREIGNRRGESNNLGNLGIAYADLGQVEEAISYHQQALAIAREIGDRSRESNHLGNLGIAYANLGKVEKAIALFRESLAIARDIGNRENESNQLGNLGLAYSYLGQVEQAISYHQQALTISQEISDRKSEGNHLGNLGLAYSYLGQVDEAIRYYQQALAIAREIGDPRIEENQLGNLGLAYYSLDQVEQAIEYYQQALAISREIGDQSGEGTALSNLGIAYLNSGQIEQARQSWQESLRAFEKIKSPNADKVRKQLESLKEK